MSIAFEKGFVMSFRAVIFDVDGVIIDTAHIHHLSWREVFKKYGVNNFTFSDFKEKIDGMPREKGVMKILPGIKPAEVKKIAAMKQFYFSKFLKEKKVKIFCSTIRLIRTCRKKGIKTAMASSSRNARPILIREGLFKLFDADAKGAYIKKGKPFPDIFLRAAALLKVKPAECVVFEDAPAGIRAAVSAGMKSVGVDRDGKQCFTGADMVVTDLSEVSFEKLCRFFCGKKGMSRIKRKK
ncbi:MAG TPA: beta-phosphoglucomutase family hydrolase [bacterium]|nr:beta-phosphoglucomutase family hydrolase [bacterium]